MDTKRDQYSFIFLLSSLRPPLHHIGYRLRAYTRGRTQPGRLNIISCIRRRGIYSFEGEPAIDVNPTDRWRLGESVSTLTMVLGNYTQHNLILTFARKFVLLIKLDRIQDYYSDFPIALVKYTINCFISL